MSRSRDLVAAFVVAACVGGAVTVMAVTGPADPYRRAAQATSELSPSPSPAPSTSASPSPTVVEEPTLAWGPTVSQWDEALATARGLSVTAAAGQVLVAAVSGDDADAASALVSRYGLAGVIVMGDAVTTAARLTALTEAVTAAGDSRDWPVIVATDQEGGAVQRLAPIVGATPAFMAAGAQRDKNLVADRFAVIGTEMRDLGFTMNLAPVADMTVGPADPTIRTRSAGSGAANVSATAVSASAGLVASGVIPVLKHFPGHGSVTTDSHDAVPRQPKTIAELEARDLKPFRAAVDAGAPVVMMSHIAVAGWGSLPASLNPKAYRYLRDELGFTGVIMTDAFNMTAITQSYASVDAAPKAIEAGADLLLMPANVGKARDGIVAAVRSGALARGRLDEAAARVILMARWQRTLAERAKPPIDAGTFDAASIVVAAKNCAHLVGTSAAITGGTKHQRSVLAKALEAAGIVVREDGASSIALVPYDRGSATADVVVAMAGPWGLSSSKAAVYVAVWGDGSAQLEALARVLTGAVTPTSDWPVPLHLPYPVCG